MKINAKKEKFTFISQNLGYRPLKKEDFKNYFKLDNNPKVRAYFPEEVLNERQVKININKNINFFKSHGFGVFVAIELSTGKFVGRCGFGEIATGEIEVGYVFLPEFWGKGLATEALIALIAWAKQNIFTTDTIIAYTPTEHLASQRVMQKAGMYFYKNETINKEELIFYKISLEPRKL